MAVQIINDMPDAEVYRPPLEALRALSPLATRAVRSPLGGRAGFIVITIALHCAAFAAFVSAQRLHRSMIEPAPIEASIIEVPAAAPERPPEYVPPPIDVVYSLPVPQELSFETDSAITLPPVVETPVAPVAQTFVPPIVESIEYVRSSPPVFPKESQRRREYGTVVLLVLVDARGRPAQIEVERSSGYARLDDAARNAVEKFLFRPYEKNGIAQPAQVRIPIGFDPPRSS
jgi:periplasmic protein TonB